MDDQAEIDLFKRDIDLRHYAASLGYQIDKHESWRGSTVLRRGGDKIVVKRNSNGHHVYFSVRDDQDNGTIIDFVQRRDRVSLGQARQILRRWIGSPAPKMLPPLEPSSKDRMLVDRKFRAMVDAPRHQYLEQRRSIPAAVLSSARFAGRVRADHRGNAIFPHFDGEGLSGYEIKNEGYTGFARGGEKGLWASNDQPQDRRLVIAESAIDALSYAALFPDLSDETRYVSLGGKPNPKQPSLLEAAIAELLPGSEVVGAFDADQAGRAFLELVRGIVSGQGRGVTFTGHLPEREGEDWNDVLRKTARQPRPAE